MLCVMEGSQDGQPDATSEFIATGRTGRRNAMPDILSSHAATSTGDLPEALAKLSCSDSGGTSGAVGGGATGGGSGGAEGGQDQPSGS
ncbi:cAMP-dependent protein kinase inhibitor alpha-like isoform X2 [Macrobrachium rosenbergii]|uniref:cAMP-dependent protein kinase inhibitor alpha-like isoform X2 n=1 Tax=Macrobrachium rosenbergii TaxID=79674 RepID=UPI0034D51F52